MEMWLFLRCPQISRPLTNSKQKSDVQKNAAKQYGTLAAQSIIISADHLDTYLKSAPGMWKISVHMQHQSNTSHMILLAGHPSLVYLINK